MVVHSTPYMSITWLSCLRKSVVEVCISLLSKSKACHFFLDCRRNLRHQSVFWWQWEDLEWRRLHRSHGLWRNRDPEVDQELYKWTRTRTRLTELKCFDFFKVSHSFLSSLYVSLFWKMFFFNWKSIGVTCRAPSNSIILGAPGGISPTDMAALASASVANNYRGIMVWYASVKNGFQGQIL